MLLYIAILLLIALYAARREWRWISVTSMLLGALLVLFGGGYLYYRSMSGLDNQVSEYVTTALIQMWLGLVIGVEIMRHVAKKGSGIRERSLNRWHLVPIRASSGDDAVWTLIGIVLLIYLALMFVALAKGQQIFAFMALDSEVSKRDFRLATGMQGGYALNLVLTTFGPFLAIVIALRAAVTRSRNDVVLAILLVSLVMLFKIATFHKSQWVWFVIQLLIAWRLMRTPRANFLTLASVSMVLTGTLLVGAQLAYPELDVAGLWRYLVYRVFEISNEGLYQYWYIYPDYIPHTYGLNVGLFHGLFGSGELVPAHTRVAQFFGSMESTFNAMFIADAWVEAGWTAVFGVSVLVGMVVKGFDIYSGVLGKSPVGIALIASGFQGVITLCSTSAFTAFLTGGLLSLPILVILVRGLSASLGQMVSMSVESAPAAD